MLPKDISNKVLSVSSIGTYQECPTRYNIKYGHGLDIPLEFQDAADRGTAVHAGMEAWLLKKDVKTAIWVTGLGEDVCQEALSVVSYHTALMPSMTPVSYKGRPLVEYPFEVEFPHYNISLKGVIDAVVTLDTGQTILVDWKARRDVGAFYSQRALNNDRQLLVYAAILQHKMGIRVDAAFQIQLSCVLPATPQLKKKGDPLSADGYSDVLAKTTYSHLLEQGYPDDLLNDLCIKYNSKIMGQDYFSQFTEIDLTNMDKVLHLTLLRGQQIQSDTEFLPVLNGYTCKKCGVLDFCKSLHFGS